MATKADVIAYVRKNYHSRDWDDGSLGLVMNLKNERSHLVNVDWNNDEGTFTSFTGVVCEWSEEAAGKAVAAGEDKIFGIRKLGDYVGVCHYQLTETIDEEEIDSALWLVARVADKIELRVNGGDKF